MRIELIVKDSYRITSNPLKEEVKPWVYGALTLIVLAVIFTVVTLRSS